MHTFLLISRHSPENCDAHNERARKVVLELVSKLPELMKKHGVKMVGGWVVPREHLNVIVFEAPSLEAFQNFTMEPEVAAQGAYNTIETKIAKSIEDAVATLLQAK